MSKNKNKQNVNEEVETETVETAEQGEVETEQKPDIEIDRDGMNDEQYIAALEQKLGQAIAEANTCKGRKDCRPISTTIANATIRLPKI